MPVRHVNDPEHNAHITAREAFKHEIPTVEKELDRARRPPGRGFNAVLYHVREQRCRERGGGHADGQVRLRHHH